MKLFAFLMALVVLALSVLPCADKAHAAADKMAKTEVSKTSHQQSSPQQDDCSPFCHCSCCASFSVVRNFSVIVTNLAFQSKADEAFLPSAITEVTLPVWQPPQLIS